jgi:hypothetical protein
MLTKRNDNPIKTFKNLLVQVGIKFDRTHTFCHIIALRFRRFMAAPAPTTGANNGFHTARNGQSHQAVRRDFESQTSSSRRPSRFNRVQPMLRAFLHKASMTHVKEKRGTPDTFWTSQYFIQSLAFHRTAV